MSFRNPKRSLVGGEIDPDLYYASDLVPVRAGAAACRNFIVRGKGGIERLPGTEHYATAKGSDRVRLGAFKRSTGVAYLAEYGPNYVRLRDVDMDPAAEAHAEVATPYAAEDLINLQWAQSNDVQWIFSGLKLKELQRTGALSFQMVDAEIAGGPLLDLDYFETRTITASAVTGSGITLTASAALFLAGHVGSLWRLHEVDYSSVPKWQTAQAVALGDKVRYNGNVYEVTGAGTTSNTPPGHLDGEETDGVTGTAVTFKYLHSGFGLVRITGFTSATVVTADVLSRLPADLLGGSAKWQEGAWSDVRGYPITGALYKNALWAGGSLYQPGYLWKSAIDGFDDWAPGTHDDSALARNLPDGATETVRWLSPSKVLAIGTDGPEWIARPEAAGDTVRVNNLITETATDVGSSDVPGITVSGATVFPDATRRKLLSITFDIRRDNWAPEELSLLAEHILGAGIVEMVYQRNPQPIFWCLLEDGTVAGLTYLPSQNVLAWHVHDFVDPVESITVLPVNGGKREALFLAIRRAVGAGSEVHIERMFDRFRPEAGDTIADARCLFAAKVYSGAPTDTFTGLDYLEGREVIALVDGNSHPPVTVTGGAVTLNFTGSEVLIGLPYESRYKSLPFDAAVPDEDFSSRKKRISNLAFAFKSTLGGALKILGKSSRVFRLGAADLDSPPELYTGVKLVDPPAADDSGQFEYVNDTAWPAMITAIFPEYEV